MQVEIGDKFQAMRAGEHELVGFGSGMVQARYLESGKVFDFGPFAPLWVDDEWFSYRIRR